MGRGTPGPAFVRIGTRRVRYTEEDLKAWLHAHRVEEPQASRAASSRETRGQR